MNQVHENILQKYGEKSINYLRQDHLIDFGNFGGFVSDYGSPETGINELFLVQTEMTSLGLKVIVKDVCDKEANQTMKSYDLNLLDVIKLGLENCIGKKISEIYSTRIKNLISLKINENYL